MMIDHLARDSQNYRKPKPPTPSTKTQPKPADVPKSNEWFNPPYVVPLQTLQLDEQFEGNTEIPQEILDN